MSTCACRRDGCILRLMGHHRSCSRADSPRALSKQTDPTPLPPHFCLAPCSGSSLGYGSAKKPAEEAEDSSLDDEEHQTSGGDGTAVPATA